MNSLLQAAHRYVNQGFSLIPIRANKRPYCPWTRFQKERPTHEQIEEWFNRWPRANVGIVTGQVSQLLVVDVDSKEGRQALEDLLPDSLVTPIATTPRDGRHYYFKHPGGVIGNRVGLLPGVDIRGDGGFIMAPPSKNGRSGWQWMPGLDLFTCPPADLPESLLNLCQQRQQVAADVSINFTKGHRDNTLFHIANCLLKGGMPSSKAQAVLQQLAPTCTPPYPLADIPLKIKSVQSRINTRDRNTASEIKAWLLAAPGGFSTSQLDRELGFQSRTDTNNRAKTLERLCQEGIVERIADKRGWYRVPDRECAALDPESASTESLPFVWPFSLEQYFRALPRNIIILAGEPDAGKTAFLLNFARLNMDRHRVHYFSSEMGEVELRDRLSKFDGAALSDWKACDFRERSANFADVIHPGDVNVIDFLEITDEFYKVGGLIKQIYDKLRQGIALIALQKNRNVELGLGGMRSLEKARLYLAMEPGKLKIIKCKNWVNPAFNPNRLQCEFKLVAGCQFIETSAWSKD